MSERGAIVLGMHRAGTSLTARLLSEIGFEAVGELVPPQPDNPEGYWEHRGVVEAHDEFLRAIGRVWSDPQPIAEEEFSTEAARRARMVLREIYESDFADSARWLLKDPRMSRLLPLWQEILDDESGRVTFVMVVRSPVAVSSSLFKRDGLSRDRSMHLWLRHMLEAEEHTRCSDRLWFDVDAFSRDPQVTMKRLIDELCPGTAEGLDDGRRAIAASYRPGLLHYSTESEDYLTEVFPWVSEILGAVRDRAADQSSENALQHRCDVVSAQLTSVDRLFFGSAYNMLANLHHDRTTLIDKEVRRLHQAIDAARREVEAARQEMTLVLEGRQQTDPTIGREKPSRRLEGAAGSLIEDPAGASVAGLGAISDAESSEECDETLDLSGGVRSRSDLLRRHVQVALDAHPALSGLESTLDALVKMSRSTGAAVQHVHRQLPDLASDDVWDSMMVPRIEPLVGAVRALHGRIAGIGASVEEVKRMAEGWEEARSQISASVRLQEQVDSTIADMDKRLEGLRETAAEQERSAADTFAALRRLEDGAAGLLERSLEITRVIEGRHVECRVELEELRNEYKLLQTTYATQGSEHEALRAVYDEAVTYIRGVEKAYAEAVEGRDRMKLQLEGALRAVDTVTHDCERRSAQIQDLEASLQHYVGCVEHMKSLIQYMEDSVSWRWTLPMRRMRRLLFPGRDV